MAKLKIVRNDGTELLLERSGKLAAHRMGLHSKKAAVARM